MAFVIPTKESFREMYHQCAPWDIGRPQKDFVDAAAQIKGSILDVGCGTGENALYFAKSGQAVTGVDFLEEPIERASKKPPSGKSKRRFKFKMHWPWPICASSSIAPSIPGCSTRFPTNSGRSMWPDWRRCSSPAANFF